jgi:1,4-alpha-glucan branching enzyme
VYATSEQFVLPLSHDEVVHGKGSLYTQMAGRDDAERLANLRLLFGYQLLQPGKKLFFMGDEFGQVREWGVDRALDWALLDDPGHAGVAALVRHLGALYASSTALHGDDLEDRGFRWLDADDRGRRVLSVERRDGLGAYLVAVCNAGTDPQAGYLVGLPAGGTWRLVCSSDEVRFGGSGHPVAPSLSAGDVPWQGCGWSAALDVPALGFVIYAPG